MEKNDSLYKTVVFFKNVATINRIIHGQKGAIQWYISYLKFFSKIK